MRVEMTGVMGATPVGSREARLKRNSLAENAIPQQSVKSRVFHHVHIAAEGFFEVGYQTA